MRLKNINNNRIIQIYIITTLLILTFCSSNAQSQSYTSLNIPYIHVNENHLILLLSIMVYLYLCYREKKILINFSAIPLVFYFVFLILQMVIQKNYFLIGNYASILNSVFVFLIVSNYKGSHNFFKKIFLFVLIILSLQIILVSVFYMPVSYNDFHYKYYMRIPIGASNYIACFIVPIGVYLITKINKIPNKILVLFICVMDLLLLKNRSGLLVLIIIFLFLLFSGKMNINVKINLDFMLKKVKKHKLISLLTICSLIVLLIGILPFLFNYMLGFTKMINDDSLSILDKLTSKRTIIYKKYLDIFIENPFFGIGSEYFLTKTRAHNFILEVLAISGLTGFILYFSSIISVFYDAHLKHINKAFLLMVVTIFLQGLFEISIFKFGVDITLWICLAMLSNKDEKS